MLNKDTGAKDGAAHPNGQPQGQGLGAGVGAGAGVGTGAGAGANSASNNNTGANNYSFDFGGSWVDDNSDFNFIHAAASQAETTSPYSTSMSPLNSNFGAHALTPGNGADNNNILGALSGISKGNVDYASQLQHYQNLLMETQSMLNMKQQQQHQQVHQQVQFDQFIAPSTNPYISSPLAIDSPQTTQSSTAAAAAAAAKKRLDLLPQPRTKTRPCDHCRRRKTRCVAIPDQHSCKMCLSKNLKCTFNESNSLKRGISTNISDNNKRLKLEDIEPPPNVPVKDIHPIKDYSTMPGSSLLKKTLSLQYPRSSFYVGPTSLYDPIFIESVSLDKVDQFTISKTDCIRKVSSQIQFNLRDDFTESLYERSERDSDTVEQYIAPHGKTLIDLYFQIVHPVLPILHKKIFLEKYARTHREFGAPLLAAVYILAIQWWDLEPRLSNVKKPNVDAMFKFALKTFSEVIHRPKLSAVQAGLLLLQCQECQKVGKNWVLNSEVLALSNDLGLGLDCSNWRLPKWERGLRRRLAWAVFIQDQWSAMIEGRCSSLFIGKNWLVKDVIDEDFPEKIHDQTLGELTCNLEFGTICFKKLISLSIILNEILDTLYTPIAMESIVSIEQVLLQAKPLQLKLRNWYLNLPKFPSMKNSNNGIIPNGGLQFSYFAAEMTLHRRIISAIHYHYNNSKQQQHQLDQQTEQSKQHQVNGPTGVPIQVIDVCRKAAKSRLIAAIEFTKSLTIDHIRSFWIHSTTANLSLIGIYASLLYVTSLSNGEMLELKQLLNDYLEALERLPKWDCAAEALIKIYGVVNNIPGLSNKDDNDTATNNNNSEDHNNAANLNVLSSLMNITDHAGEAS